MRALLVVLMVVGPLPALAQTAGARPAPAVEVTGGYVGVVDDATIDYTLIGGAARFHLSPRVSVGPELQYMIGSGDDRIWIVTGNVTVDFLPPGAGGRPRTTPYVVAGGGIFTHRDEVGTGLYTSSDPAFTAGGGLRVWLGRRVYVAPEYRIGWELHQRISGTVGIALR